MKVGIIGGGAAGMLAASLIAEKGHKVVLFEKNEKLGKKIYITGKGRCNVTNASFGEDFLKNIVNGKDFMRGAISRFDSQDLINFIEAEGTPLKIERGNRVFPVSDKASDITKALERSMKKTGVLVCLNEKVERILTDGNKVCGLISNNKSYDFDAAIIATGGISYPTTGSTGDGYEFAKSVGHKIIEPVPSLCAIKVKDSDVFSLEGLSLKNVKLIVKNEQKIHYESEIGEMIFAKNAISGPLCLTVSSKINRFDLNKIDIFIDFKPAIFIDELIERINNDIANLKAKQFSTLLEGFLPKSLVSIFAKRMKIDLTSKANQLSKVQRKTLAEMLKGFKLSPLELEGFNQAVVTSGGVNLKEINPKNMQSKLIENLYFIGEVLDIDAVTGGFNLQLAFSTAAACANDFN